LSVKGNFVGLYKPGKKSSNLGKRRKEKRREQCNRIPFENA
jgi:hypothetical protein